MKIFRNIFIFSAIFGLSLTNYSCSDDFLDLPSDNALIPGPDQIEGIQNALYTTGWFDFNFKGLISQGDIYAGNIFAFDGEFRQFAEGIILEENPVLNSNYLAFYKVINQSNSLLTLLESNKSTLPTPIYNQGVGVAKFMRGTAYFYLVRIFGAVPLINEKDKFGNSIRRNPVSDVYKFINLDFDDAIAKLPEDSKKGRLTKFSAMGMLAKVKLNENKYSEAASLCQKVMDSGRYSLVEDYGTMFNDPKFNNHPESLFSFQWSVDCSTWGTQNTEQAFIVPAGSGITGGGDGWGTYQPVTDVPKLYEPNDNRRKSSIMIDGDKYPELLKSKGGYTFTKDVSQTASNFRKYIVGSPSEGFNVCFMRTEQNTNVLRYADVLLMYVEAKLAGANTTSDPMALNAFNQVRTRAGLPSVTSVTQQSLFKERRVEFMLEGQYYFDLQRRNRNDALNEIANQERGYYTDAARTILKSVKVTPTDKFFTMPLPSNVSTNNPTIKLDPVPYIFN